MTTQTEASSTAGLPDTGSDANENSAPSSEVETEQGAKQGDDTGSDNPLLDVVKSVLKEADTKPAEPNGDTPTPTEEAKEQDKANPQESDEGAKAADKDDLDADGKPLPFHKHPRWQEVKKERDQYREQAEAYKGDAEQYGMITQFMDQKGLTADEVGQGFQVMDLVKNSPEQALQYFENAVDILRQQLGKDLPDDLMDAVDRGEISEDRAFELSEARAKAVNTNQRYEQATRQLQQTQQAERAQQAGLAMAGAVTVWERNAAKNDPDFGKKAGLIATYAKALRADALARGETISTPEAAVRLAQQAYDAAQKQLGSFTRKPATDPVPSGSVSAKRVTQAEPTSLAEAVRSGASMPVSPSR